MPEKPRLNLTGNVALDILRKRGFTDEELDEIGIGTLQTPIAFTKAAEYRNAKQQDLNKQMDTETIPPTDHNQQITMEQTTFMDQVQQDQQDKKVTTTPINLETAIPGKVDTPKGETSLEETHTFRKPSVADKFQNSFLGKNVDAINAGLNAVSSIAGQFDKDAYEGPKGGVRQGIDQGWNTVSEAAAKMGPYGQMVSMGMNAVNAVNSIQNALLGSKGLDNMTTTDAILSSPLGMMIPGLGLINALAGKNADTITKNEEAFAQVGSSYGGSSAAVDDALNFSGKRYGAFSSGARQDANALIAESRRQQNLVEDISSEAAIRRDLQAGMSSILGNRRAFDMQGGYNQRAIHFGREGMVLAKRLGSKYNLWKKRNPLNKSSIIEETPIEFSIEEFKNGGSLNNISTLFELEFINPSAVEEITVIKEFKEGGSIESNSESSDKSSNAIEYALNRFPILASLEPVSLQYDPNFNPKEIGDYGDIEYVEAQHDTLPYYNNYPKSEENKGKSTIIYNDKVDNEAIALDWLTHGLREYDENWKDILELLNVDPVWKHRVIDSLFGRFLEKLGISNYDNLPDSIKKQLEQEFDKIPIDKEQFNSEIDGLIRGIITNNRESYAPIEDYQDLIKSPAWKFASKYLFGNDIDKYAEGGKFNVIPEGALHARLHHMDNDENITKKGIPVVSENKEGELEQHAEIEKEEIILRLSLTKRLEELAKEDTDEAAIEAGKILVEEILNNTVDNTGLLNNI